jgi:formamidopyrimidine-DNA glycosylase
MLLVEGRRATIRCSPTSAPSRSTRRSTRAICGDALRARTAAIKLALMDNGVVVGVGNIYANEALFRAGIRPTTPARKVSRPRIARLVDAVREVLGAAIDSGGSTLRDYVDAAGRPGRAQLGYFVYGARARPARMPHADRMRGSAPGRRSTARPASAE